MKTLFIVRHAKSSWEINVADWQRPITEQGINRAQKVADKLAAKKIMPDKIISSYAFRALNTAMLFASTLQFTPEQIEINAVIYEGKTTDILNMLRNRNDKHNSIMIFGHNPAVTELYNMLTGKLFVKIATSTAVSIEFNIEKWKDLGAGGKMIFIETGKD